MVRLYQYRDQVVTAVEARNLIYHMVPGEPLTFLRSTTTKERKDISASQEPENPEEEEGSEAETWQPTTMHLTPKS